MSPGQTRRPLVLLNGLAATAADWDPVFLMALAERHDVVALEHRGMGGWPDGGADFTIEDLAADVAAAIDDRGLDAPIVLGWSLGGMVAQALALSRPDLVGALALLATSPGGPQAPPIPGSVLETIIGLSAPPREQASRLIDLLFPPTLAPAIDAEFGELVAGARGGLSQDLLRRQVTAIRGWQTRGAAGRLDQIAGPVLVACGMLDTVVSPAASLILTEGIPGAWLARFPDAGHAFMAQAPQEVTTLVGLIGARTTS